MRDEAGDLVLTPGMAWHDHGNEGGAPVYWMDILDWQIVRFLENLTFEPYPDEQQPALRSPGPDIYFPWTDAYAALQKRLSRTPTSTTSSWNTSIRRAAARSDRPWLLSADAPAGRADPCAP